MGASHISTELAISQVRIREAAVWVRFGIDICIDSPWPFKTQLVCMYFLANFHAEDIMFGCRILTIYTTGSLQQVKKEVDS